MKVTLEYRTFRFFAEAERLFLYLLRKENVRNLELVDECDMSIEKFQYSVYWDEVGK